MEISLYVLIFTCFLTISLAKIDPSSNDEKHQGECATVNPVSNFNLSRYISRMWYGLSSTRRLPESCFRMKISEEPAVCIHTVLKHGRPFNITVPYTIVTPGVFTHRDENDEERTYTVVDTDYDNYSIVQMCKTYPDDTHDDVYYIFGRKFSVENQQQLQNSVESLLHEGAVFRNINQDNCPF